MVDRLLGRGRETAAQAPGPASIPEAAPGAAPSPAPVATDTGPTASPDAETANWARVQLARNLRRPRTLELLAELADATEWVELHGDRRFGDDAAIVTGLARIDGRRVMVIGHQKGAETEENIRRNFGMPHPEGYRKAMRAMELAERFRLPVVTFVDTPGAFPGPAAEERGVAEAIAMSVGLMTRLRTPIVTVITGEGGSGGALAIAVGDVVIGLENAVYSVISPEGCASILWRTGDRAASAALAMRMSAQDQLALGVLDQVVDEPGAGAHTDHVETARRLRTVILSALDELVALPIDELLERRYARYRAIGPFVEVEGVPTLQPERVGLAGRIQGLIEAGRRTIGESLPPLPGGRRDDGRRDEPGRESGGRAGRSGGRSGEDEP